MSSGTTSEKCKDVQEQKKLPWATSYENTLDDLQSVHGKVYQNLVDLSESIENILNNVDFSSGAQNANDKSLCSLCKTVIIVKLAPNSLSAGADAFNAMMNTVYQSLKSSKASTWGEPHPNAKYNDVYDVAPPTLTTADCHQSVVNFFAYTMNKIPKPDADETPGGSKLKPHGVLLKDVTIDNDMQTDMLALADFHVVRMAQLALFKTVFQLVVLGVQSELAVNRGMTPVIKDAHKCISNLENVVAVTLDYSTTNPNDDKSFSDLERLYFKIKSLSNDNASTAHFVTKQQRVIDLRRSVLQTALNANLAIDRIIWWSKFQKWLWIVAMIVVTVVSIVAVLKHNVLILYIEGAAMLFVIAFIFMMNWLNFTISGPFMSDISASVQRAFHIPTAIF